MKTFCKKIYIKVILPAKFNKRKYNLTCKPKIYIINTMTRNQGYPPKDSCKVLNRKPVLKFPDNGKKKKAIYESLNS